MRECNDDDNFKLSFSNCDRCSMGVWWDSMGHFRSENNNESFCTKIADGSSREKSQTVIGFQRDGDAKKIDLITMGFGGKSLCWSSKEKISKIEVYFLGTPLLWAYFNKFPYPNPHFFPLKEGTSWGNRNKEQIKIFYLGKKNWMCLFQNP